MTKRYRAALMLLCALTVGLTMAGCGSHKGTASGAASGASSAAAASRAASSQTELKVTVAQIREISGSKLKLQPYEKNPESEPESTESGASSKKASSVQLTMDSIDLAQYTLTDGKEISLELTKTTSVLLPDGDGWVGGTTADLAVGDSVAIIQDPVAGEGVWRLARAETEPESAQ